MYLQLPIYFDEAVLSIRSIFTFHAAKIFFDVSRKNLLFSSLTKTNNPSLHVIVDNV